MNKFTEFILKFKFFILALFGVLIVSCLLLARGVVINYDLAQYLPVNSTTKQAISTMEKEFGYPGRADVMAEDITIPAALETKQKIEGIDGVKNVLWLDDFVDVATPLNTMPESVLNGYYKNGAALFKVEFEESDYSLKTGDALLKIRETLPDNTSIAGSAENSFHMRNVLSGNILKIILIVVPLCILILMFASSSWIEPLIYIAVIGISIALNMGTNIFFNSISYMTYSMASVLQLAISMDYSIFLFHRYTEERDKGADVTEAIKIAVKNSLSSISASALTTIAGFLALLFMEYKIGADLGIVLAKGIALSFFCVIIIMPIFIYIFNKQIEKTRHKAFLPSFEKFGKLTLKLRFLIIPVLIVILIPAFLAQQNNSFIYGDSSASSASGETAVERKNIEDKFGILNPVMLLVPNDSIPSEKSLSNELKEQKYIKDVQSIVTLADPQIPRELLPDNVKEMFLSENYSLLIVLINSYGENPDTFSAVDEIKAAAQKYYPDKWLAAGTATSVADIKKSVDFDSKNVMLFSIIAVGIIILLTFRSLSIPVLLVAVIQSSIWINMSFPYFSGSSLVYIGYLVVSSLQLGATIDYAILMSNRYMERRREQSPKEAAISAIKTAGNSIMVSALILTVAGFSEGFLSQISSISEIGFLLGRGALLSGILVLIVLPSLLVLFDKLIMRTTLGTKAIISLEKESNK